MSLRLYLFSGRWGARGRRLLHLEFLDDGLLEDLGRLGRLRAVALPDAQLLAEPRKFNLRLAVATSQWGLFRDAGSFDRPRSIERNDMMPKDVANAIRVRRSRGNKDAPRPAARMGEGSRPSYND